MYGYNPQMNIDKINNQIQELERIRNNYQNIPQQPIQNIINTGSNIQFEARILKENEKVDEILVNNKTMFFDPFKGKLTIKQINGDIEEYDVVLPKTKEQLKIEELERRLAKYEQSVNDTTVVKKQKPISDDRTDSKDKS